MVGVEHLVQARLAGWAPFIDLLVGDPIPRGVLTLWRGDYGPCGEVYVEPGEIPAALDLRCCHGLPVVVHAPDYDAGRPVFDRLIEFEPARAWLCTPDSITHWSPVEAEQWAI